MKRLVILAYAALALPLGVTRASADGTGLQPALRYVDYLTVVHRYHEAEDILDSLDHVTNCRPELHFRKMTLYYTWLDDFGVADSLETPFRAAVDSTIRCANRALEQDPDDAMARYYKGMGYTYRSLYDSYMNGISVSTVRSLYSDATEGVDNLARAYDMDNGLNDALLGVGKYHHWKATRLPWPFGRDGDRKKGLREMQAAVNSGLHWRAGGVQTLGGVYMEEERYEDVVSLVTPMHERYPKSRFFSVLLARAYMELGRLDQADEMLDHVMENLSAHERSSTFITMKVRRYVAQLRLLQGREQEACDIAQELLAQDYPRAHHDWLRRKLKIVKRVEKEACGN